MPPNVTTDPARGAPDPPLGVRVSSSLIASRGEPTRSICALTSSGSAEVSESAPGAGLLRSREPGRAAWLRTGRSGWGPGRRRLPRRPAPARRCRMRRFRGRLCGSARSRSGASTCDSSQSIMAARSAVMRMLPGLGSPWTTHAARPASRAHRAEVDPGPGLGVQEVGRPSPARALRPDRVARVARRGRAAWGARFNRTPKKVAEQQEKARADDGNRTRVTSLEGSGCGFAEQRQRGSDDISAVCE
jgi:hypothetical protein